MFERHTCLRKDAEDVDLKTKTSKMGISKDKDAKDKPDVFLMQ